MIRQKTALIVFILTTIILFSVGSAIAIVDGCYDISGSETVTLRINSQTLYQSIDFDDLFCFSAYNSRRGIFDDSSYLNGTYKQNGNVFVMTYAKKPVKQLFKDVFSSYGLTILKLKINKAYIKGIHDQYYDTIQGNIKFSGTGILRAFGKTKPFSFNAKGNLSGYNSFYGYYNLNESQVITEDAANPTGGLTEEIAISLIDSIINDNK
jgi:hypothetical protein